MKCFLQSDSRNGLVYGTDKFIRAEFFLEGGPEELGTVVYKDYASVIQKYF